MESNTFISIFYVNTLFVWCVIELPADWNISVTHCNLAFLVTKTAAVEVYFYYKISDSLKKK